jgi:hypothetical protein
LREKIHIGIIAHYYETFRHCARYSIDTRSIYEAAALAIRRIPAMRIHGECARPGNAAHGHGENAGQLHEVRLSKIQAWLQGLRQESERTGDAGEADGVAGWIMDVGKFEFASDQVYVLPEYGAQATGIPSSATAVTGVLGERSVRTHVRRSFGASIMEATQPRQQR